MDELETKYRILKIQHGFTDGDVADWFNYKNPNSFRNSARRADIVAGLVRSYEYLQKKEVSGHNK